ncbi:hypothetical protein [Cesiribacter sp. SM1]|uniref:hypothetical protein n=1 Tax=Cesiribacter sp. SM1 TaxID=2861196 RepID=UPI001CD2A788|nr:hypothetical protein [Cesiribacter sp. SM1]
MEHYNNVKALIQSKKLTEAVQYCEDELKKYPSTDFHWILNRDLLHLKEELFRFIDINFGDKPQLLEAKAFYSELNGFSINWDKWFFDVSAYDTLEDYQDESSDWLGQGFWGSTDPEYLVVSGWERLQEVFKDFQKNKRYKDKQMSAVSELAQFLVVLRLQELFDKTISHGKQLGLKWANLPWGVTAHGYYLVYEINNN